LLLKYRNDYEKVAMGLLSLIPDFKDIHQVNHQLEWYQQSDKRELFLYKNEFDNIVGIVGSENMEQYVLLRLIALTPQARGQQTSSKILTELMNIYPKKRLIGTLETTAIVEKWEREHGE